jgi:DEAD/DEAH box helicase domain-containing protein
MLTVTRKSRFIVRAVRNRKPLSQMVSRAPKGRSKVTNGRQLFIDGDARLKVSRRFRDVLASIATDLGGADRLSEGQKQIARRCAMLSVECEIMESAAVAGQPFDLDVYGQLTDRLGRAFQRLGLKRVMHDVTPDLGAYGRVGEALKAIKGGVRSRFPLFWFDFIAKNATRLFEGFVKLFPELSDQDSLANLYEFAHGGEKDGLAHLIAEEYRDVETEIASIEKRVADNKKASDRLKQKKPPDLDQEDRLNDLDRERRALRMIRDEIQKGDNLAFLTDRGILPNYAFPEAGVTLKSILFRAEAEGDEARRPTITEYIRSAASALTEFAPGASFYVQGRKLKVDQIDLSASPIEYWRVCPDCIHTERAETETTEACCPSCGSEMWSDRGARRPMVRLRQVLATGSDRSTRIPKAARLADGRHA